MRALVAAIVLALVFNAPPQARCDKPHIKKVRGLYTLILPNSMKDLLRRERPGFVPWGPECYAYLAAAPEGHWSKRNAHYAVIGDFNGDGVVDVVVAGIDGKDEVIIGIISGGKGYSIVEASRTPLNPILADCKYRDYYLKYYPPGPVVGCCDPVPLLKNDGFAEITEKTAVLFAYERRTFQAYTIGD
jgi:hypothetical protein